MIDRRYIFSQSLCRYLILPPKLQKFTPKAQRTPLKATKLNDVPSVNLRKGAENMKF